MSGESGDRSGVGSTGASDAGLAGAFEPGAMISFTYRVEALLARGGMGEVYRTTHTEIGTQHAIKIVRPDLANNDKIMELFRREASVLRTIRDDAIVGYDGVLRDEEGRVYLVMEFVDGPSLTDYITTQGTLDPSEVRYLRDRLAHGLAAAHDKGVIHRDMSPDNVILGDGQLSQAKIIDFGIAKLADSSATTIIGDDFAGRYAYASPEQIGLYGGQVDARSDIYSLGLVLATAGTGKALNMGEISESLVSVIEARKRIPDFSSVPEILRNELGAMLQPDPADRPQTMRDVIGLDARLDAKPAAPQETQPEPVAQKAAPLAAEPAARPSAAGAGGRPWLWPAATAGVAIAAAAGYFAWQDTQVVETPTPAQPEIAAAEQPAAPAPVPAAPPASEAPSEPEPAVAAPAPAAQIPAVEPDDTAALQQPGAAVADPPAATAAVSGPETPSEPEASAAASGPTETVAQPVEATAGEVAEAPVEGVEENTAEAAAPIDQADEPADAVPGAAPEAEQDGQATAEEAPSDPQVGAITEAPAAPVEASPSVEEQVAAVPPAAAASAAAPSEAATEPAEEPGDEVAPIEDEATAAPVAPEPAEQLAAVAQPSEPEPSEAELRDAALKATEAGLSGEQKREIQRDLRALGHYRGGVDGSFGPGTRAGIENYQKVAGLEETGYLTDAQRQDLALAASRPRAEEDARLAAEKTAAEAEAARVAAVVAAEERKAAAEEAAARARTIAEARAAENAVGQQQAALPSESELDRLRRIAEAGDPIAQASLGLRYYRGEGVRRDLEEAFRWTEKAAEQGEARAQSNLGFYYMNGEGVGRDPSLAARWWQEAAAQGLQQAQFNLGLLYETGQGVPADPEKAARWYRLASDQGDRQAKSRLEGLIRRGLVPGEN